PLKWLPVMLLYGFLLPYLFFTAVSAHAFMISPKDITKDFLTKALQMPINGNVTDQNGNPIPGATVLVEGSTTGTATNLNGDFSIDVPEGAVLVISFIGYEPQRITIENQSVLNIVLQEDLSSLEEVVVVGYG